MKTKLTLLLLLQFTSVILIAQSVDSKISTIRIKFNEIRADIKSYKTSKIEIGDESTEGGEATAYYRVGELKLIEVVWLGETGKRSIDYYFDRERLIFAFNQDFEYNRPIYWDKEMADENDDSEFHDPSKTIVKENRYYFANDELLRWLDNNKNIVELIPEAKKLGQELITHSYELKKVFKK